MKNEKPTYNLESLPLPAGVSKVAFACVYVSTSVLLLFVTFAGNMAGTGETLREAWIMVGIYTAIVAPTGYFCLSWKSRQRGPLHVVGWLTLPSVSGLVLTGMIFEMAEYTASRGTAVFEVAGRITIGALALSGVIWVIGCLRRRLPKRPSRSS